MNINENFLKIESSYLFFKYRKKGKGLHKGKSR